MLIALDIGNTNITIGVFQDKTLKASWRLDTDTHRLPDEYAVTLINLFNIKKIDKEAINSAVICSVVPPLTVIFEEVFKSYFSIDPLVVSSGTKTGVKILYDSPRDVGTDRVVDTAAAFRLYGGPIIIVDFGTATVFDAVTKEGWYLGGAIAPGLSIAAESLFNNTSQLRRVEIVKPPAAIGKNTTMSMQSGIVLGHIGMVESMIERFKKELGADSKVVATGGYAEFMSKETKMFDFVNPELTLTGLKMILEMNI